MKAATVLAAVAVLGLSFSFTPASGATRAKGPKNAAAGTGGAGGVRRAEGVGVVKFKGEPQPAHEEEARAAAPAKPATTSAPPGARGATTLALAADPEGDLAFDKKQLEAKAGRVAINLANRSEIPHNVVVEKGSEEVASSETVTDATTSLTAELEPGEYTFYCSVAGHRDGGMEGALTVE